VRYLSVCSGIEAATVAWHPLGWTPVAFSEIEAFPSAVLAHHYPDVPNLGDMTRYRDWGMPRGSVDLVVGGTPCQSFSVAGLRKGLADPRGNLALVFLGAVDHLRPEWVVWENVPGVLSSNGGRDFGAFLGGLAELGYGWAYRVLDAQFFGVAQRRRRVFVVASARGWQRAAAVLFERESLSGHPAPRREAGEGTADGAECGFDCGGTLGPRVSRLTTDECAQGAAIVATHATVGALCADSQPGAYSGQDAYTGRLVPAVYENHGQDSRITECGDVAPTVSQKYGTGGNNVPLVLPFDSTQVTSKANRSKPRAGDTDHPLAAGAHPPAIAFTAKDSGADAGEISPTLRAGTHSGSHANGGVMPAVAFVHQAGGTQTTLGYDPEAGTAPASAQCPTPAVHTAMAVRRLTPRECERLQGFPDDYTLIPYRGKLAADGPRYKALGNSMAVPVVRWIGERIEMVAAIEQKKAVA
jgi:DNA (cytosine-5)-methyltransferase 1